MQSTFGSACAYGALSTLTCVLFFWNAELLPGFDLAALCDFTTSGALCNINIWIFVCTGAVYADWRALLLGC
jgi:hypothetical protein